MKILNQNLHKTLKKILHQKNKKKKIKFILINWRITKEKLRVFNKTLKKN